MSEERVPYKPATCSSCNCKMVVPESTIRPLCNECLLIEKIEARQRA